MSGSASQQVFKVVAFIITVLKVAVPDSFLPICFLLICIAKKEEIEIEGSSEVEVWKVTKTSAWTLVLSDLYCKRQVS